MDAENSFLDQTHSVTLLIQQLKDEDREAAEGIWRRYFERLLPLARAKLKGLRDESVDEEDVLVSVFDRFFKAAQEDRFAKLDDRSDLWQILITLTERRVADQYRKSHADKRGGGNVKREAELGEVDLAQIREMTEREPDPQFVAAFNDQLARALDRLKDDRVREVALLRLEGYRNREIAERLGVKPVTIERKLRVIREAWDGEFGPNPNGSQDEN